MYQKTYDILTLGNEYLTSVTVLTRGNQAIVNAIVELGYNPLLCVWKENDNTQETGLTVDIPMWVYATVFDALNGEFAPSPVTGRPTMENKPKNALVGLFDNGTVGVYRDDASYRLEANTQLAHAVRESLSDKSYNDALQSVRDMISARG